MPLFHTLLGAFEHDREDVLRVEIDLDEVARYRSFTGHPMTSPPCPPIRDADWSEAIAGMKAGVPGALNVYRTIARHPALLQAWAPLRQHVVKDSALGPVRPEVVILRAAQPITAATALFAYGLFPALHTG